MMDNKTSIWEEYKCSLNNTYNECRNRRERVDFILSLVKKGLTRGREGVDYLNWDGHLTLYAGRLEWVKEDERPWQAMSRIMTEGIGEFLKDRRPVVFFPSTKSLRSFLKGYVVANMPINVPQELKALLVNRQTEEETRWWQYVRKWIDCETSKMIDRICARYKAYVPILCRAKFPEWAVKWVYDETVGMKRN